MSLRANESDGEAAVGVTASRPILLIDDSPDDLFFVKRLLLRGKPCAPVVTVDGGAEAVSFLRASLLPDASNLRPALVFCDLKMPGVHGFEVLQWVREQADLRTLPFFTLSGSDAPRDVERALALGASGYIVKFPPARDLNEIARAALRGEIHTLEKTFWAEGR